MPRGRVLAALVLTVGAAAIAGCGGGDDPEVAGPGSDEAEQVARTFLAASLEGDTQRACGQLTEAFRAQMEQSIPCESLVDFQNQQAKKGAAEFDSTRIDASSIEELELQVSVSPDGQTASVTGPTGAQTIGLETVNGKWAISSFSGPDGPA
jgi:hypothetical protein